MLVKGKLLYKHEDQPPDAMFYIEIPLYSTLDFSSLRFLVSLFQVSVTSVTLCFAPLIQVGQWVKFEYFVKGY